jgi:hypothetical protein
MNSQLRAVIAFKDDHFKEIPGSIRAQVEDTPGWLVLLLIPEVASVEMVCDCVSDVHIRRSVLPGGCMHLHPGGEYRSTKIQSKPGAAGKPTLERLRFA